MSNRFSICKSSVAITMIAVTALFLGLTFSPKVGKAEPMKIAYLSPSFDISDAWERVFWAIQGRLDELEQITKFNLWQSRHMLITPVNLPR